MFIVLITQDDLLFSFFPPTSLKTSCSQHAGIRFDICADYKRERRRREEEEASCVGQVEESRMRTDRESVPGRPKYSMER